MLKNKNNKARTKTIRQIISALFVMQFCHGILAQEESLSAPLPGDGTYNTSMKVQETHQNQPVPIVPENDKEKSVFLIGMSSDKYPISINGLKTLVDKSKEDAAETSLGSDTLDPILAWLDALMRAHNRLANAFVKQSDLKSAYENECSLIRQLRGIKNEILYIKAQDLIKGKKLKQAIPMLIDITCSEPNSALGLKAYQHLKQSGFSGEGNLLSKQTDDLKVDKEQ
jgi:hypothetical protein